MKTRVFVSALAAAAGLATMASAQVTSQATVSITMTFEDTGNNNGIVEPGESARINMNASFTGFNTVATVTPGIGTFTTGTIRGFGSAIVDLNGTANNGGNANGAWDVDMNNANGLQFPFDVAGQPGCGTPGSGGARLINVQPGQFSPSPSGFNTSNPAFVWTGVWTPDSYASRTVTFQSVPGSVISPGAVFAAVLLRLTASIGGSANVTVNGTSLGNVQIPVAPAPASLALLGLGALVAGRRRR